MKKPEKEKPEIKKPDAPIQDFREEDYYLENGLLVFTSTFHKKRGYCCGSRCRHCPYEWEEVKEL